MMTKDHHYPRQMRLVRSEDFQKVYQQNQRVSTPYLLVYYARNQQSLSRFGYSVSRKHGNAVKRNQLKRWLRESVRLHQHLIPQGIDIVLIPKRREDHTFSQCHDSLSRLISRIQKQISMSDE